MATKVKITVEDARVRIGGGKSYRVVALVNTLEPAVGSLLDEAQANLLIDAAHRGEVEVNVRAAKR